MSKNFSLFLALRYLKPKRTFVSIITLISVIGVTLGVAVLIVVISVMAGFEEKIREAVLGFEPHLVVEKVRDARSEHEAEAGRWDRLKARLEAQDLILEATPYIEGRVLMQVENKNGQRKRLAPIMRALEHGDSFQVQKIRELMKPNLDERLKGGEGELDLQGDNIVMSRSMARGLGVSIGDTVDLISPKQIDFFFDEVMTIVDDDTLTKEQKTEQLDEIGKVYKDQRLTITGLFHSLRYEEYVIIPLTNGQRLYEFEFTNDIHGLAIHTGDPYSAARVDEIIRGEGLLTDNWRSQTWMEKHELFFEQIRNERAMMYFVLFFIVIVAAFSIMNTIITVTVQKRKEIGVMKALGARESQIVWVFLLQGMIVGALGMLIGFAVGNLVIELREPLRVGLKAAFGMQIFPEGLYGVAEIPERRRLLDMVIICVGAFVLSTFGSLLPAWFAARLDPAKALRE